MRSDARRTESNRRAVPVHAVDDVAQADRLSKARAEADGAARGNFTSRCHGRHAKARNRSAGLGCVIATTRPPGAAGNLGSVRVSRAGFGVAPKRSFLDFAGSGNVPPEKLRDRETRALPRRGVWHKRPTIPET